MGTPVNSSTISEVDHDKSTSTLEVTFNNGAVWKYCPVTEDGYNSMLKSDSVGSYFIHNIRDNSNVTATKVRDKNKR